MGKNVKWKYEPYAFYNKAGIEERLAEMAEQGWFIEKMGFFWKYRKGEPAKRTYNVVYFYEDESDESESRQKEFVSYCEAAGWCLAVVSSGMLIFYHDGKNPVPIETDAELELENIHHAMTEIHLIRNIFVALWTGMFIWELVMYWRTSPLTLLASNEMFFMIAYIFAAALVLLDTCFYSVWRKRCLKTVEELEILSEVKSRPIHKTISDFSVLCIVIIGLIVFLGSGVIEAYIALAMFVFIAVGSMIKSKIKNNQRIKKLSKIQLPEIKQPVGFVMIMIIGLGIMVGIMLMIFHSESIDREKIYEEKAAVTLEDIKTFDGVVDFDSYYDESESVLLKRISFDQSVEEWNHNLNDEWIYFDYQYIEIKASFVYDLAFEKFCENRGIELSEYTKLEHSNWNVKQIYQDNHQYLIIGETAFADVRFSWKPTDEQLQIVIEKLKLDE